ncbi:MAG: hypothetical protein WBU20_17180, partial [Candidatus Acidiferrum sp.]
TSISRLMNNRVLRNLLFEPPVRLLVKIMLSNPLAFRYAFRWAALFDAVRYPAYALGLQTACRYARLAGARGFTALEFGVAGGNGLRELTVYAQKVSKRTGLEIHVVGFDTGMGLPLSSDYRDVPWLWQPGDFPCDVDLLRRSVPTTTELVIGLVEDTLPRWLSQPSRLPIGFVSVDVDYFSGSEAILNALGSAEASLLLPFVSFYFDDVLRFLTPRSTGEYAAIAEFNSSHRWRKFDRDDWLAEMRPFGERLWLRRMYSLCCFDHPAMRKQPRSNVARLDLTRA